MQLIEYLVLHIGSYWFDLCHNCFWLSLHFDTSSVSSVSTYLKSKNLSMYVRDDVMEDRNVTSALSVKKVIKFNYYLFQYLLILCNFNRKSVENHLFLDRCTYAMSRKTGMSRFHSLDLQREKGKGYWVRLATENLKK